MKKKRKTKQVNAKSKEDIKKPLFYWTDSRRISDSSKIKIYHELQDILNPTPSFPRFESAFSLFMGQKRKDHEGAFDAFMKALRKSGVNEEIRHRRKTKAWWPVKGSEFEDFKAVANVLANRESESYLSDADRALISEKSFLQLQGIEDDVFYICRIKGLSDEWMHKKELKESLLRENEWVVGMIRCLHEFLGEYMPKLIKEHENALKWVIDYFGAHSVRWIPDWKDHVDSYARHKPTFTKSYRKTIEYLEHGDIKCLGYTNKNKHLFTDTHWIRGRILLLAQVYELLFGTSELENYKKKTITELANKVRKLFKTDTEQALYRKTIECLYFEEFPENKLLMHSNPRFYNALLDPELGSC